MPTVGVPPSALPPSAKASPAGRWSVLLAAGSYLVFGLSLSHTVWIWFSPDSGWGHLKLGRRHEEQNDYPGAVARYSRAIEADPRLAEAYLARGVAYRILNQVSHALDDLNQAVALDPASPHSFVERGEVYRRLTNTSAAMATATGPSSSILDSPGLHGPGRRPSDMGNSRQAIADFR